MKPFLIYTFSFDMGTGGIKVMHKLCHLLNELNYVCELYPINSNFETYHKYNTPLYSGKPLSDYIIIYPEIIDYNPLMGNKVVRWILGVPGYHSTTYSNSDIIYWYGNLYKNDLGFHDNNLLVHELHEDIFYDKGYIRNGKCHTFRKSNSIEIDDSELIPFYNAGSSESKNQLYELAEIFNKKEYFISYDDHTFLSIFARMCGCISVVNPNPNISKESWLNSSPLVKYGIAYGFDDIERSKNTIKDFWNQIIISKRQMLNEVIDFAENCQRIFKYL